jgi:hypothetical protein
MAIFARGPEAAERAIWPVWPRGCLIAGSLRVNLTVGNSGVRVEASVLEEPGGGKPHAGICAGGVQQWASLPRLQPCEVLATIHACQIPWQ